MTQTKTPPTAHDLSHPKVMERAKLKPLLDALQREGKRVVFTNGCYDILHPGHVDLLARCRASGDVLVVGINTDASVKGLGKAPNRPLNPLEARAFMLAHLASVDFVTFFHEPTPKELVDCLAPDILIKGGDWPVETIAGRESVQARGGTVMSLPLLGDFSTTALVEKILKDQ